MRFFLFYLLPFSIWSQQMIDSEAFFNASLGNYIETNRVSNKNINFPWVEKYGFRTETGDSEFERQEYSVRLSISSPGIRNAQKALYDELRSAPDSKGLDMYCVRMMIIHNDWLTLYIIEENKKLLENSLAILDDKQLIYQKMFGTLNIDPEKLIKLRSDRTDLKISLNDLKIRKKYLLLKYGFVFTEIDFSNFLTVKTITREFLSSDLLTSGLESQNIEIEHKKRVLDKEIALVNAEQKKILDFVQVKYTGPHSDLIEERISIGLSLELSNSGSKKLKIQELKIKQQQLSTTSQRNNNQRNTELTVLTNNVQRDIATFSYYSDIIQEEVLELAQLSKNISQSQGTSPLLLLDIKERNLSLKLDLLTVKKELLEDYVLYMVKSERLCNTDGINYLNR